MCCVTDLVPDRLANTMGESVHFSLVRERHSTRCPCRVLTKRFSRIPGIRNPTIACGASPESSYSSRVPLLTGMSFMKDLRRGHADAIANCPRQKGVFGAAPSAILSGMLADIWTPKQRGFAMPCAATFLAIGPILGPTVGNRVAPVIFVD